MTRIFVAFTFAALVAAVACSGGSPSSPSGTSANGTAGLASAGGVGLASVTGGVTIKKFTNDQDADQAPGPTIPVGSQVTWTYVVTNRTTSPLTSLTVTDDQGVAVSCPKTLPAPGQAITCTASGVATLGQYANIGKVTATANGTVYTAADPSHYLGVPATAGVTIKKFTNDQDADDAPGPAIPVGNPVTWTYVVTNRTTSALTSLAVTDDQGVAVSCPKTLPAPGQSITCTASGIATAGQYANVGKVTAMSNGTVYTASDPSHYFGVSASGSVTIKKFTNDQDADVAPGPSIPVGSPVIWTYVITNRTLSTLTSLMVTDDKGVAVSCPKTLPAPGQSITCTASGVATAGQYANVGTVTATSNGTQFTASDPSHYFGVPLAGVTIRKFTNGQHVSQAPGPSIVVGDPVSWTYVVTNISPSPFTSLTVTDDQGVAVSCSKTLPAPGQSITCTGSGVAVAGQYHNVGSVVATGDGNRYTDSDDSFYFGQAEENAGKVELCHRTGNGSYHLIDVSVNAEPAHLAHGDGKPGGPVPGNPGHMFTASCAIQ